MNWRIQVWPLLALILVVIACGANSNWLPENIAPETTVDEQELNVKQLIQRVVGKHAAVHFEVEVNKLVEFRSYKISLLDNGKIFIVGWDGLSVAKGFHYYLKNVLHKDVDWFKTYIELPTNVHLPNITHYSSSASPIIYYQNVCTWGYSFVWWNFGQWRRHIDWMAMMGISLTIAPVQEAIWHDVYAELGLRPGEIDEHFAGPAFQAWQRMGNIRGWGGPLPSTYKRLQLAMQKKIINAQRALGMAVALPAFAGHVPIAMRRIYPNASFTQMDRWNHFSDAYCCSLFVEPNEPLFGQLAEMFVRRVVRVYGSNHIYFCDPFNEMQPRLAEPNYMRTTAASIYAAMRTVDEQAVWLLQGWMFIKNTFWSEELTRAFLTAVPRGRMLVLDLQSEQFPQYQVTRSYYGQPFIWCMLHNFGGTLGMFGSVDLVNRGVTSARRMPNSTMVGVGITPEGIGQNYVLYALTLERGWSEDELELREWFDQYSIVRYGVDDSRLAEAWQLLRTSVYSFEGLQRMRGKYTITRRPALNLAPWSWYNASSVLEAWRLLLSASDIIPLEDNRYDLYEHDLVDVTRQFLQQTADQLYVNLQSSYRKAQVERFEYLAGKLLALFDDLERILASSRNFLLGTWLSAAKQLATNPSERLLFEFNARNQITAWGPNGEILDYATKQWSGVVQDYYKPRWAMFLDDTTQALKYRKPFNSTAFKERVAQLVELPFSNQTSEYPTKPIGNALNIAQNIYETWHNLSMDRIFLHHNRLQVQILH